jgi:hypothetical protein
MALQSEFAWFFHRLRPKFVLPCSNGAVALQHQSNAQFEWL